MDNAPAAAPAPYTNADYVRHLAGEAGAAPPPVAPTPGPATPAAPENSLMAQGVSEASLRSALAYEVAGGRLSQAEADAMLAEELGVHPSAVRAAAAAGTDEVTEWLAGEGFPPATQGSEFTLCPFPGSENATAAELLAMDQQVRDILVQSKITVPLGNYLVQEIARSAEVYSSLDERSKDLLRHEARAQLQRIWGDETREMLEGASDLAHELDKRCPGFWDLMEETGAGDNPRVIIQLAEHGRRLRAGLAEREARSARR